MKSVCRSGAPNTGVAEDNELCNPEEEDDPSEETGDMNVGRDVNVTIADAKFLGSSKCTKQGIGK